MVESLNLRQVDWVIVSWYRWFWFMIRGARIEPSEREKQIRTDTDASSGLLIKATGRVAGGALAAEERSSSSSNRPRPRLAAARVTQHEARDRMSHRKFGQDDKRGDSPESGPKSIPGSIPGSNHFITRSKPIT